MSLHIIAYLFITTISLLGCNKKSPQRLNTDISLTHQLIFSEIKKENYEQLLKNNEKIYLSPILKYRPSIFPNDKQLNHQVKRDERTKDLLLENYSSKEHPLIIPDSLKEVYHYYSDSMNIASDSSLVLFLSPLLPTKKKDVFLIQRYVYYTIKDREINTRIKYLEFNQYQIKNGTVKRLKTIPLDSFTL